MLMATMPIAPPPFDVSTLDLTIRLKAGSAYVKEYVSPANGGNGYWAWFGSPSAGISGTIDCCRRTHTGGENFFGDVLDGKQTVRIIDTQGGGLGALVSTADVRSGANTALPAAISDIGTSSIEGTSGTMWALFKLVSYPGGTTMRQIVGQYATISVYGTGTLRSGNYATGAYAESAALSTGVWVVVFLRWAGTGGGATKEMRINKGGWISQSVGPTGTMNTNGPFDVGLSAWSGADAHVADVGVSLTAYATGTCDDIYDGLKALYPSAGLP